MDDNREAWPIGLPTRNPWIDCQGYQNVTGIHLYFDDGLLAPALSFDRGYGPPGMRVISAPRANHRLCKLVEGEGITSIKTLRLLKSVPHYDFQPSDFMVETEPTYEDITEAIGLCLSIALMLGLEQTWTWWSSRCYHEWRKLFKASIKRELERGWSGSCKVFSRLGVKVEPPPSWDLDVYLEHLAAVHAELDELVKDPDQHTTKVQRLSYSSRHWSTYNEAAVFVSYNHNNALGYKRILEVCDSHLPESFPWLQESA